MNSDERTCRSAEDAVAFALHALEPDEEAVLREHLLGCRSCQATVSDTELTAAALAAAVEQVEPPARLRANILDQVAHTPQSPRSPQIDSGPAAAPRVAVPSGGQRRDLGQDPAGAGAAASGPGRSAAAPGGPGRTGGGGVGPDGPSTRRDPSGPGRRRRGR